MSGQIIEHSYPVALGVLCLSCTPSSSSVTARGSAVLWTYRHTDGFLEGGFKLGNVLVRNGPGTIDGFCLIPAGKQLRLGADADPRRLGAAHVDSVRFRGIRHDL